ncbi:hypothetical protein [Acidisoma silvae]|uniref:Sulfur globule protein CV1 n=1 Tax=Acidisoma silvae TaxID=2802396 RepID=A0A963YSW9_9PROT|nr:hypothetical protein [Acidisoma silvae]MCB8875922.1 hypothetical protein [Acidisoma silvae]
MRLFLSTLAAGAFSLALPMVAAHAAPMGGMDRHAAPALVQQADWNGYHQEWRHDDRHEWRGDYEHHWHRHWDRPPPPPYGYYAPPPPPPPQGYVYGYSYGY